VTLEFFSDGKHLRRRMEKKKEERKKAAFVIDFEVAKIERKKIT